MVRSEWWQWNKDFKEGKNKAPLIYARSTGNNANQEELYVEGKRRRAQLVRNGKHEESDNTPTSTGEYKGVAIHPKIKEVLEQFEYKGWRNNYDILASAESILEKTTIQMASWETNGRNGTTERPLTMHFRKRMDVVEETTQLSIRKNNRVPIREIEVHGTNITTERNR